MQTRTITNALRARKLPLELVRGNGYMYFIYDTGAKYNTKSIMVPRVGDLSLERWIAEGNAFAAEMEQEIKDAAEKRGAFNSIKDR